MFDIATGWILCGFGDRLANGCLHLVRVRLRQYVIEIQVHRRLIDAIKILQVSECDQPTVAKSLSLVGRQLRKRAGRLSETDQQYDH